MPLWGPMEPWFDAGKQGKGNKALRLKNIAALTLQPSSEWLKRRHRWTCASQHDQALTTTGAFCGHGVTWNGQWHVLTQEKKCEIPFCVRYFPWDFSWCLQFLICSRNDPDTSFYTNSSDTNSRSCFLNLASRSTRPLHPLLRRWCDALRWCKLPPKREQQRMNNCMKEETAKPEKKKKKEQIYQRTVMVG